MKLTLNLPALERLISGDTEIELHLRQQICEQFARHHLKGLLNELLSNTLYKKLQADFEADFKSEVTNKLNEYVQQLKTEAASPYTSTRASWTFKEPIEHAAQKAVDAALCQIIEYQKRYWSKEIETAVKKHIEADIKRQVEAGIQQRLTDAAQLSAGL